ncbi:molecular chaperone Hsp33 [Acetitomaculum ruminis DSM 5522]|uniref:33 kDa chaperonin n=1 Tax=Acetitomaculum ruminis DSM 5522 TaxID=1120918 RepID=A0A1I0XMQ2_9FIRM|nr:Hsp33 family molecular chaperone HslO [Acetitomaculum ruminis]SFB02174.1 molecular chaperone Hsp33 [Acetitomaculum ruminis DSM 5522]
MSDYIVRATAADDSIRAFAMTGRETVEFARKAHETSPVVTAALGRLLCAGAMMGSMMKGEKDVLTLMVRGTGPIKGMTVTAKSNGFVKGYPQEPVVLLPARESDGKLDVGAAVGGGYLTVIKDLGLKEPYSGQVPLRTGEIAEDLTYYFAESEQVASSVGLGVLMEKNNTVKQAGGFIIQLMPDVTDEVIDALEKKISTISSVTTMLDNGYTPEKILEEILGDFDLHIYEERIETGFKCDCSRRKVEKVLHGIDKHELQNMIDDDIPVGVECHFCNTKYLFSKDELRRILVE